MTTTGDRPRKHRSRKARKAAPEESTPPRVSRRETNRAIVVSAAADGIVVVDHRGVILLCNPAAADLLGRSEDELVGTAFGFPIVVNEPTELTLTLPDGTNRVVEARATTTILERTSVYVAALRDITRRSQAERALHIALDQQTTAVAVAAHQLDNPLSAICLLVHRLREDRASLSEEEQISMLDLIAESTTHLQTLLRKYTTVTRIDAEGAHPTSRALPLLDAILQRLADFGENAHDVHLFCDPALAVLTDPVDFSEMLGNYLDNALTHGRPPFEITAIEDEDSIEIRVGDHGPGVSAEFTERLFERFSRADTGGEGTGLGLWIVRQLAQAHGGDAWYEPCDRGGSRFCLRLRAAARQVRKDDSVTH